MSLPGQEINFGNPYWGDNVPADVPPPRDISVVHECDSCGNHWEVMMDFELGGYFYYNEEHKFCPKCGAEGHPD